MKQFILLSLLSGLFFSCEEETPTPSPTPTPTYSYSPPTWIHGLYRDSFLTVNGQPDFSKYEFLNNDIINTSGVVQNSFSSVFPSPEIEEITDSTYHIKKTSSGSVLELWFIKRSSQSIKVYTQDPTFPSVNGTVFSKF